MKKDTLKLVNELYPKILKEVGKGLTIDKACKYNKIARETIYDYLTKEQKRELIYAKTAHSLCGMGNTKYNKNQVFIPLEEFNEYY